MNIKKLRIPFRINYPLKIIDESKKINFINKKERQKLFKRNLFYYKFKKVKNDLLEKRYKIYLLLAREVVKFVKRKHPKFEILNVSVFGSALFSQEPKDFDFLVIVKGNAFLLIETKLKIKRGKKSIDYPVGISIKGVDNLSYGILSFKSKTNFEQQKQIIDRTAISLFRRHLPIFGYDFIENEEVFKNNIYAQCQDLLNNTYNLYYLKKEKPDLTDEQRARKILSRLYESTSYLEFLEKDKNTIGLRKKIYNLYNKKSPTFFESKRIFDSLQLHFEKKSRKLRLQISREITFNKDEKEFLSILEKTKKLLSKKRIDKFLPVMAKIVDEKGDVIAFSKRVKHSDGPIHAEVCVINNAKKNKKTNWKNYTLYCPLEPCEECMNIITKLGIKKVVYCLVDPLLSYYGKRSNCKNTIFYSHNSPKLIAEFQELFIGLYKKRVNLVDTSKILNILSNKKLRKIIGLRLKKYWKLIRLPYQWVNPILKILLENKNDEYLALKKVRDKFPGLIQEDSLYSKKLAAWRKRKIKNLSKKLSEYLIGRIVADVGGRTTDFAEQIIKMNKKIKKVYITDIGLFSKKLKNRKIAFLLQPKRTILPFKKSRIDTIILSMVLHHLNSSDQIKLIKNIIFSLSKQGRIILIEDTYPENVNANKKNKNIRDFLKLIPEEKKKILAFYDWFGNKLMRNRDQISLLYNYKSLEGWKILFEKYGLKQIYSEFIEKVDNNNLSLFPPKGILIFKKFRS